MKFTLPAILAATVAAEGTRGKARRLEMPANVQAQIDEMKASLPRFESACDMLIDNQARGLCVAYEKKECDTEDTPSCTKIAENYEAIVGVPLPQLGSCPCYTLADLEALYVSSFAFDAQEALEGPNFSVLTVVEGNLFVALLLLDEAESGVGACVSPGGPIFRTGYIEGSVSYFDDYPSAAYANCLDTSFQLFANLCTNPVVLIDESNKETICSS